VEQALRIRSKQLQAIEEGDFSVMPGRVYAIGFVRAYSEYLGLDGDKMVGLFKDQYAAFRKRPSLNFPTTMSESKLPSPFIIMGSLVAGILFIAFWSMFMLPSHSREQIPEVPEGFAQSSAPVINTADLARQDTPPSEEAPVEASQPKISPDLVELVVSEKAWTEIKDASGNVVLRQILNPGDKYTVPEGDAGKGLTMSTGNAGGITIFIGGKKLGKLGTPAKVRRNILLDAKSLQKRFE
jgi:cytoskeletal protein RodZ